MLSIKNIRHSFPDKNSLFEIKIDEIVLKQGEILFLYGRSGCGKTTLLNLIGGAIKTQLNDIIKKIFDKIGYVMHESTLLPWANVRKCINVEEKLRGYRFDMNLFEDIISDFSLPKNIMDVKSANLSLGMRQRVEIAKALSFKPNLLILDEALSGLDAKTKSVVMGKLLLFTKSYGLSIIATAHQKIDILRIANRVYKMDEGTISGEIKIEKKIEERLSMKVDEMMNSIWAKEMYMMD